MADWLDIARAEPVVSAEVVHLQVAAKDAARLEAFYTAVCGWSARDLTDRYRMLHESGDGPSVGLAAEGESRFVPTLAVADVEDVLDRVVANGGTRLSDPVTVPGVGLVASFRDPEGQPVMVVPRDPEPAGD